MVPPARPLRAILPLLFLCVPALWAADYYLSYRIHIHNYRVVAEHLYLSRAMVPFHGTGKNLCTFVTDAERFETFAETHAQPLLECLFERGVLLHSRERIVDLAHHDDTLTMLLPPTPLQVEFNDGLVIIREVSDP
ncbi:hypothetical protein [Hydrogenimonas sp.]